MRGEPKSQRSLCEFAEAIDPDCTITRYRMVLTVIVADQAEGEALAERLRAQGFDDAGWKHGAGAGDAPLSRMMVGAEATVMIALP